MKREITCKLNRIASIWNHFIREYDLCKKEIKFRTEVRTNYFGDIVGYFNDTFDIIFDDRKSESYSDRFSNQISLLQSIYVQQDFIEELLIIFKCKVVKGDLKKDSNYSINRDIRNELVGHPIRKLSGEFISSCLFAYNGDNNKIVYLRYHKDNNYEFESMEYLVSEIIERHKDFLNKYFDLILDKLKRILSRFVKRIEKLETLIPIQSFEKILNIASAHYESIFRDTYIYDKESLLKIYARKDEHRRYQNLIDKFKIDLKNGIKETKEYVNELFEPRKEINKSENEKPLFDLKLMDTSEIDSSEIKRPVTYHYELGKIATNRNPRDFEFYGGFLKSRCEDNELVISELKHMELNIYNEIEYYTAYRLICTELKED